MLNQSIPPPPLELGNQTGLKWPVLWNCSIQEWRYRGCMCRCLQDRSFRRLALTYVRLGVSLLYAEHGASKLDYFILRNILRLNYVDGQQLETSMAYLLLELRISQPFFQASHHEYKAMLTPTWISHLWAFISMKGLKLEEVKGPISTITENTWLFHHWCSSSKTQGHGDYPGNQWKHNVSKCHHDLQHYHGWWHSSYRRCWHRNNAQRMA